MAPARCQPGNATRITADQGVWVAFAGFAGATGEGYDQTAGRSAIWSPDGRCVAAAGAEPGDVVTARLTS